MMKKKRRDDTVLYLHLFLCLEVESSLLLEGFLEQDL